jgi:hypothetical protein
VTVLLVIVADPVPVLEVDPHVLDRLSLELCRHALAGGRGHRGLDAEGRRERDRVGRVDLEQPARLGAELGHGPLREAVGRHVHGVQRLARPGEALPMLGLGLGGPLDQV